MTDLERTVPAENFCSTLEANLDNNKLSDTEFRDFVRRTLPIVVYPQAKEPIRNSTLPVATKD